MKKNNNNEIIIYTTEYQKVKIEVLYKDNNLWLTQKKWQNYMELIEVLSQNI